MASLDPAPSAATSWREAVMAAVVLVSAFPAVVPVILVELDMKVSQSVFINGDIYRINKLTTTDKALYRFHVADKSVPPIYLRELS